MKINIKTANNFAKVNNSEKSNILIDNICRFKIKDIFENKIGSTSNNNFDSDLIQFEQQGKMQDRKLNDNSKLNDRIITNNNLSKISFKENCLDTEKLNQLEFSVENLKNRMCQAIIENNTLQKDKEKILITEQINQIFDIKDPSEIDTDDYLTYFYQSYICCKNINTHKKHLTEKVLSFNNSIKTSLVSSLDYEV